MSVKIQLYTIVSIPLTRRISCETKCDYAILGQIYLSIRRTPINQSWLVTSAKLHTVQPRLNPARARPRFAWALSGLFMIEIIVPLAIDRAFSGCSCLSYFMFPALTPVSVPLPFVEMSMEYQIFMQ
jgi:hypothetical protein